MVESNNKPLFHADTTKIRRNFYFHPLSFIQLHAEQQTIQVIIANLTIFTIQYLYNHQPFNFFSHLVIYHQNQNSFLICFYFSFQVNYNKVNDADYSSESVNLFTKLVRMKWPYGANRGLTTYICTLVGSHGRSLSYTINRLVCHIRWF